MKSHEINQYLQLMIETAKIDPAASIPITTYIDHVSHLTQERNEVIGMNMRQTRTIRRHVEKLQRDRDMEHSRHREHIATVA